MVYFTLLHYSFLRLRIIDRFIDKGVLLTSAVVVYDADAALTRISQRSVGKITGLTLVCLIVSFVTLTTVPSKDGRL